MKEKPLSWHPQDSFHSYQMNCQKRIKPRKTQPLSKEMAQTVKLHGYSSRNYIILMGNLVFLTEMVFSFLSYKSKYLRQKKLIRSEHLNMNFFMYIYSFSLKAEPRKKGFVPIVYLERGPKEQEWQTWESKNRKEEGKIGGCVIQFAAATWDWCLMWLDNVRSFVKHAVISWLQSPHWIKMAPRT